MGAGLRGQGYQRKGGAAATRVHNERVRQADAERRAGTSAAPAVITADGRTDARASASAGRPSSVWLRVHPSIPFACGVVVGAVVEFASIYLRVS